MKKYLILAFILVLCSCAKKPVIPESGQEELLASRWQEMQNISNSAPEEAYRIQWSLRFGTEGDTRRVTGILWGNNTNQLRLDVLAGVGTVVAKIAENGNDFVIYLPTENKAYFHNGEVKPLLKIGVPIPFDLTQMADLLIGKYNGVFGKNYQSASITANGAQYALAEKPGGMLELNDNGLPQTWDQGHGGWKLVLTYEDNGNLPHGLRLTNSQGKKAILLVKEREQPKTPFVPDSLQVEVPKSAKILPMPQNKSF